MCSTPLTRCSSKTTGEQGARACPGCWAPCRARKGTPGGTAEHGAQPTFLHLVPAALPQNCLLRALPRACRKMGSAATSADNFQPSLLPLPQVKSQYMIISVLISKRQSSCHPFSWGSTSLFPHHGASAKHKDFISRVWLPPGLCPGAAVGLGQPCHSLGLRSLPGSSCPRCFTCELPGTVRLWSQQLL